MGSNMTVIVRSFRKAPAFFKAVFGIDETQPGLVRTVPSLQENLQRRGVFPAG